MEHEGLASGNELPAKLTRLLVMAAVVCALTTGCSIRKFAIKRLGDALAQGGTTFASDDDPDLIKDSVPFSLKLMESLLQEVPRHRGLLFATSSGFTQYAYAFVQQEADEMEARELAVATAMRARAKRLYLRARNYGLRGLETRHAGFEKVLRENPRAAVVVCSAPEAPLMYWTAASWGSAIALSKDDRELVADQPIIEALIDRALELNEAFDQGAIHSFLISYEQVRQGGKGDPALRSRKHFDRAMELSGGFQAAPLVALAESVSITKQDKSEFQSLLHRALAIDVNARPELRLVNLIMQRRARWLLSRTDELILESTK